MIAPLVARFCLANPGVSCEIDFSDRNIDLIDENFDLAIRAGALDDTSSLVARKIKTVPLITLASPAVVKSLKIKEGPQSLNPSFCLPHYDRDWIFRKNEKVIRLEPRGHIQSNNAEALVACAIEGMGVIQVAAFYGIAARAKGELVSLFGDWQEPEGMTFHLVYSKHSFQTRRLRLLIEYILKNAPSQYR